MKRKFYLHNILDFCDIIYKKNIPNIPIHYAKHLNSKEKNYISFFNNPKYLNLLKTSQARAVIISQKFIKYLPKRIIPIVSNDPDIDFAKILTFFYPESYFTKISYNNLTDNEIVKKYKNIKFGINFYLEDDVKIGRNVFIGNNVTIKKGCVIGNNVILGSNVILENSIICDDVHICDGTIIGKKGFGFKFIKNKCIRIPHIGKVIINKGCEIGSNCVIDRGSIKNTTIGENTFIDNLVQIAHNVIIGKKCILASQVGIAGSTCIGDNVVIGGQAGISGHLVIGNNVKIGGKSGVIKNIDDNKVVMGYPAKPFREFVKDNNK